LPLVIRTTCTLLVGHISKFTKNDPTNYQGDTTIIIEVAFSFTFLPFLTDNI